MCPQGEIRKLVAEAIRARGQAGLGLNDLSASTQIGYKACRAAIGNLMRAKQIEIVGREKQPHAKQWVALYAVIDRPDPAPPPSSVALQTALMTFGR